MPVAGAPAVADYGRQGIRGSGAPEAERSGECSRDLSSDKGALEEWNHVEAGSSVELTM